MKNIPDKEGPSASNIITVPLSVRLPVKTAVQLYLYAERMNISAGKLLASLLEDVFHSFEQHSKDFTVRLRMPQVYRAMEEADLLNAINKREVEDRLLKRTEPSGPMGRPSKSRSVKTATSNEEKSASNHP
jgi:hypothetical protein